MTLVHHRANTGDLAVPTLIALGRLEDFELIQQGSRHALYRGRHEIGAIVVKKTLTDLPGADAVASLRHEHALLHSLDLPGVVRVLGLARTGDGLALVMEDAGRRNLAERLEAGPLSVSEFLEASVQIAEAVVRLHAAHIVHRDINPSNVLWDEETGIATLVDFGIATTLSALTIESRSPALLEGTLHYISPEQTGRTGRSVDSRTDLYSLGATFYEMLTGSPPFKAEDPVELVHAHLARRATPPHEVISQVPRALSSIVTKLLEKDPEERYQTAEALATDLGEARRQWTGGGTIHPFPLAFHDVPRELGIPDKLYGRDNDVRTLKDAFSRSCEGPRQFVLVTGAPGVGKSALVRLLEQPAVERRGFFISGKFDQLQRIVPYAGLAQAFRMLVRHLLTEPESVLATWRDRIERAVTPNGQVLASIIPEVERIIGPQPPVSELGPVESKNRFNLVFTAFLRVLARPEHPFALFLDDLQWIDAGSLQLLEQWIADAETRHFLLLGAYRDAEVGSEHPLARSLGEMRAAGITIQQIHLEPIGREHVSQLIADTLKQEAASVQPIAGLVAKKTAGNPFFVRRLLHALHAEKLIRFSTRAHMWEWDLLKIEQAPSSDNVLHLMVQAIERLPEETRKLLEAAACIGYRFDLSTLAEVTGRSRTEATRQLWPALEDGLLLPIGDAYKAPRREGPMDDVVREVQGFVQFVHDRVQQAAYSLLTDERRRALHLDIGRRLLQGASDGQLEERLFDVVDQLDLGETLVQELAEHLRLAELNLAAGRKAKASAAYQAALNYLTVGVRHLPAHAWEGQRELSFALHRELAECAYLTGQHARAEELVQLAMGHAPSNSAKIDLYSLRVLAATNAGNYARALESGREGLALFGHAWPRERLTDALEVEAALVMENVGERVIDELAQEREVADEETTVCMRLLSIMGPPAYFSFEHEVLQFVVMRLVNLSLRRGASAYSAYGYTFYGAIHNGRTGDYETGHAFGRLALALAQRFANRAEESRTLEVFGLIVNPWRAPLRTNVALFKEGYRAGVESGELQYAAYNLVALLMNGLPLGLPLPELLKDIEAAFEFTTKHKNKTMLEFSLAYRQGVRNLTGRTLARVAFDDEEFEETRYLDDAKDNLTALAFYWVIRLQAAYLLGDLETARKSSEAATKVLASALGMVLEAEHVFYTALTVAGRHETAPPEAKPALLEGLSALNAKLNVWAKHCPENFLHKAKIVEAEGARLAGEPWTAMRLYDEAIEYARTEGFIQDVAIAHELAGRLLLSHGRKRVAAFYLQRAREAYQRWGATAKVRSFDEAHIDLLRADQARVGTGTTQSKREVALDALGLIKASQAISAETDAGRLFDRVLRVVLEVAGAQKAVLVLDDRGTLKVRAEAVTSGSVTVSLQEAPLADRAELPQSILRYAARIREPLVLSDARTGGPFASDPAVKAFGIRSVLCIPLHEPSRLVGILYLENNAIPDAFPVERVEVVRVLGGQVTISVENSTLLAERERSNTMSRFLASASAALGESLDIEATLASVAQLAVQALADFCVIDLLETDEIRCVEVAHANPAHASLAAAIKRRQATPERIFEHLPTRARLTGPPVLLDVITDQSLRAIAQDEDHYRAMTATGARSLMWVPLKARERTLGALTFLSGQSGHRYDEADLATAADLAQRCAMAIESAHLYKETRDAVRLRDEFLTLASHELRTPLTTLSLQSDGLLREIRQEPSASRERRLSQRAERVRTQTTRLEELVDGMLDVGHITGDQLQISVEPIDVVDVVRDIAERLRADSQRAGSPIQVRGERVLGRWDRIRLETIVSNLLHNAVKFGGGMPIEVGVEAVNDRAWIKVTDHGNGVQPEDQERIFRRFERAVSARHFGGLGLGLWVARQLASAMKGSIAVESQPGRGATFFVDLPRDP